MRDFLLSVAIVLSIVLVSHQASALDSDQFVSIITDRSQLVEHRQKAATDLLYELTVQSPSVEGAAQADVLATILLDEREDASLRSTILGGYAGMVARYGRAPDLDELSTQDSGKFLIDEGIKKGLYPQSWNLEGAVPMSGALVGQLFGDRANYLVALENKEISESDKENVPFLLFTGLLWMQNEYILSSLFQYWIDPKTSSKLRESVSKSLSQFLHATGWGFGAYAGEFHLPQFVANHFSTRAEKAQPETLSESFRQAALQAICLEEKGWQENYENLSLGHQLLLDGLQVDKLTSPKRSLRLGVLNCLMGQSFHFRPELQRLVVTPQEVLPKGTYEVKAHQGLEVIHPLVSHPVFLERVIPLLSEDLCENEWPLQERILAIRVLGAILYEMVDRLGVEIKEDEKWGDLRELFNKAVIQLGDAFECDTHVEVRLQIQATLKRLGSLTYLGDAAQAMTQTTAEVLSQEAREQSRSK